MKRFAAHQVYTSPDQVYKQYVVEVENGLVKGIYPLTEETPSTVWLGGIIIFSGMADYKIDGKKTLSHLIEDMTSSLNSGMADQPQPIYAYSLNPVDFVAMSLVPDTRLTKLEEE